LTETKDGIYKTRTGNHGEKLIQVRASAGVHYWRYMNEETREIRFVPAR
jgi:hypothetical protein